MKVKKRKKTSRGRGNTTYGRGFRKKGRGSGEHGGAGHGGSGDQKQSYYIKKYEQYFGKRGFTSKSTAKKINKVMNLRDIEQNAAAMIEKETAKKTPDGIEINLEDYKILGDGEIKGKYIIKAKSASKSAAEKIEKAGGKLILEEEESKAEEKE